MEASANIPLTCPGKNAWPELVGLRGLEAAQRIEEENRFVQAIVLLEGTPATRDYRCNRVRVWVNEEGRVIRIPRVG